MPPGTSARLYNEMRRREREEKEAATAREEKTIKLLERIAAALERMEETK